ncbi:hypothetical protein GCM10010270_31230 [Streptomyces violaceus]|nr:hypothetical protein GCM10010270_31230 [Streptomyces janthinus]
MSPGPVTGPGSVVSVVPALPGDTGRATARVAAQPVGTVPTTDRGRAPEGGTGMVPEPAEAMVTDTAPVPVPVPRQVADTGTRTATARPRPSPCICARSSRRS